MSPRDRPVPFTHAGCAPRASAHSRISSWSVVIFESLDVLPRAPVPVVGARRDVDPRDAVPRAFAVRDPALRAAVPRELPAREPERCDRDWLPDRPCERVEPPLRAVVLFRVLVAMPEKWQFKVHRVCARMDSGGTPIALALFRMWGLIPAAGEGSRIKPLAFSKELLPLGSRHENGRDRPRAVSEYLIERMLLAGVDKLCFVISPKKTDILQYYGSRIEGADVCYVVQPQPAGLCDALFRSAFLFSASHAPDERVLVGLPDTIWFPEDGFTRLPDTPMSFLLFPVQNPELFDAVVAGRDGMVERIQVKQGRPASHWIWGAFSLRVQTFLDLHRLWRRREPRDEFWGTLVNAWLAEGGRAQAVTAGQRYFDIGTVRGYQEGVQAVAAQVQNSFAYASHPDSQPAGDRAENTVPGEVVP